jgi:hypothetical protein
VLRRLKSKVKYTNESQDGSTLEVKKVLPESSRYMFLPDILRWFYLKGQDGSNRKFKIKMVLPERERWYLTKRSRCST